MKATVYLDNAATSFPKAPGVGEEMLRYVRDIGANMNRAAYASANEASLCALDVRTRLKRLFSFPYDEDYIVFTPGNTYGLNQILRGFLRAGDHVIISSMEHNAVMRPFLDLERMGVAFSRIKADSDGVTDVSALPSLIKENTKLVVISHASNVSGTLAPVDAIAALCRERAIPLALDAAQTAGHYPIDFASLGLSAMSVPAHKGLLAAPGLGALLLSPEFAANLTPLVTGGTGSASDSEIQPSFMPDRFESGTENIPAIFGLNAALGYIESVGVDALRSHEALMTDAFIDGISALPVRVAGTTARDLRVGVVSLDFPSLDNAVASYRLEREFGILTRAGLHCAPSAHRTLGTFPQGTVRFSFGYQTSFEDIERAVSAVSKLLK